MKRARTVYDHGMKTTVLVTLALLFAGLVTAACNSSGLAEKPRANFAHLACLDVNGDGRINAEDADHVEDLADFNADDERDAFDAAFVEGVDIALAPDAQQACDDGSDVAPEYLVAHDFLQNADVTCAPGDRAVLVVGVAGGVDDLKDDGQAAGVREIVNTVIGKLEREDVQTIGVIAGSALYGAENSHAAMEEWLTNAVTVYLDALPLPRRGDGRIQPRRRQRARCRARLEQAGRQDRIVASVMLDRIEAYYGGDLDVHAAALAARQRLPDEHTRRASRSMVRTSSTTMPAASSRPRTATRAANSCP